MKELIIDVRERDEYASEHIPGSLNVPLTHIQDLNALKPMLDGRTLVLMCRSGRRAAMAKDTCDTLGLAATVYEGGILAWKNDGKPTQRNSNSQLSLFRQVQIIVGGMVLMLSLLAYISAPSFALGTAALGGGLFFAGISGHCMLASLLKKLPWNKVSQSHV